MSVTARRFLAVIGGALLGLCVGAGGTTVVQPSSEGGFTIAGIGFGIGIGLMVAAALRE